MFLIIFQPNRRENPMQLSKYLPKAVYIRSCGQRKINVIVHLSAQGGVYPRLWAEKNQCDRPSICPRRLYIQLWAEKFLENPRKSIKIQSKSGENRVVDRETSMKQLKSQSGSGEKCIMGRKKQQIQKYSVY